jgi:hypothetical protein
MSFSNTMRTIFNLLYLIRKGMIVQVWSIRVFSSDHIIADSLNEMNIDTPSLQASDVNDVRAEFVADPFIIENNSLFYMFFEVMNKGTGRGEIAVAISFDGKLWNYQNIVLREPFHLSYPYVFTEGDETYMIPETAEINRVLLYKATQFPFQWKVAGELFSGHYFDPSIVKYNDKWWIFAGTEGRNLHLFYSTLLEGPWTEHPRSPVITNDISTTRPGGRVIVSGEHIYRYSQDCSPYYGNSVRVFKVSKLSETDYEEEEISEILSGTQKDRDWRKDGMHHIDQLKINDALWLVAVDGHRFEKWNYFTWKLDRVKAKIFN